MKNWEVLLTASNVVAFTLLAAQSLDNFWLTLSTFAAFLTFSCFGGWHRVLTK